VERSSWALIVKSGEEIAIGGSLIDPLGLEFCRYIVIPQYEAIPAARR
jgi:hypothetical protein